MNHAEYSTESHCKVMRLTFCTYNFTNKLYVQLAIYTVCTVSDVSELMAKVITYIMLS